MRVLRILSEGHDFLRSKSWSPRVRKRTAAGVILPGFPPGPSGGFRESGFPARDENLPVRQESSRGRWGLAFWNMWRPRCSPRAYTKVLELRARFPHIFLTVPDLPPEGEKALP